MTKQKMGMTLLAVLAAALFTLALLTNSSRTASGASAVATPTPTLEPRSYLPLVSNGFDSSVTPAPTPTPRPTP